jgi:hypothetical protein
VLNIPFIRESWIPKLRSGEIKQGNTYLHKKNTETDESAMCCLGVAYEAIPDKQWIPYEHWHEDGSTTYITQPGCNTGYLDVKTKEFIGITHDHERILVDLNDNQKKDFNHIADVLESWCNLQEMHAAAQPE